MNERQRAFLDELAERIPRLFEAISAGNVRAEFIVGLRRVGRRNVRLKLVAEVIDPGANPLGTHGRSPSAPIVALRLETIPVSARERKAVDRARRNSDPPPDEAGSLTPTAPHADPARWVHADPDPRPDPRPAPGPDPEPPTGSGGTPGRRQPRRRR